MDEIDKLVDDIFIIVLAYYNEDTELMKLRIRKKILEFVIQDTQKELMFVKNALAKMEIK